MSTILEAAQRILEAKVEYSPKQLQDMTKVLLSLGCSYDDINEVRTASKKGGQTVDALIKLCGLVASNQSAFNSIFAKKESVEEVVEDTLTEEIAAKLKNDVLSLKKISWNLDKITKKLITSTEYGKGVTSELIASLFTSPKAPKAPKVKAPKQVEWPKDPKGRQVKDQSHAENFVAQANESEGTNDITHEEAYQMLLRAGYSEETAYGALRNMGIEPSSRRPGSAPKMPAKKAAKKRED